MASLGSDEVQATPPSAPIELKCSVSGGSATFASEFCRQLIGHLSKDLGRPFQFVEQWTGSAAAVVVTVAVTEPHRAQVSIAAGAVENGVFHERKATSSSLSSRDQKLSPGASRTLVRGVGLALGLVR